MRRPRTPKPHGTPDLHDLLALEVATERRAQIRDGFDMTHDLQHGGSTYLATLASQYVVRAMDIGRPDRRRDRFIQAAAILLAAVEALDREDQL